MSTLDKLVSKLNAIAIEDIVFPDKPIPIVLQEAHDLSSYLSDPENENVVQALLAVGLPKAEITMLPRAIDATRDAQSRWVVARDRTKSDAQQKREADGITLRSEIVAAARWNLRSDRVAQATVDAIQEGEGIEDLVQDLVDLAALVERHDTAFEQDETFDAEAMAERARSTASGIRAGLSEARGASKPNEAKLLRDRAFTYLEARVRAIREAGRYAFRKDGRTRARFASIYERDQRRRQRSVPVEPETTSPEAEETPPTS